MLACLSTGYDADGVVLKLDDLRLHRLLGHGRSDPDWAIALKFPAQVGESVTNRSTSLVSSYDDSVDKRWPYAPQQSLPLSVSCRYPPPEGTAPCRVVSTVLPPTIPLIYLYLPLRRSSRALSGSN